MLMRLTPLPPHGASTHTSIGLPPCVPWTTTLTTMTITCLYHSSLVRLNRLTQLSNRLSPPLSSASLCWTLLMLSIPLLLPTTDVHNAMLGAMNGKKLSINRFVINSVM